MATSSGRGTANAETWRGGFPGAEAKSLFIYFAIPFVSMFRKEGVGGLGGGRKGGHVCVVRKWWKKNDTVLVGVKVSA